MKKFLNILIFFKLLFLIFIFNVLFFKFSFSQCNSSPCFCLQINEVGELTIIWDTFNLSNNNLYEHQFYADTGGNGFVLIGSETDPNINFFNFNNYFAGNSSSSYFIKSLYGPFGSSFYFSDTISSIYFDLVNLFDGRVSLSWNHPMQIGNMPLNSQYIIEKSLPFNPPTSALWNQVISLSFDSSIE